MTPRRVLLTLDAVGGVWRYAVDLAAALQSRGIECRLLGFGPTPDAASLAENVALNWCDAPLDWMAADEADFCATAAGLADTLRAWRPDLLHVHLPSLAAGLPAFVPTVVTAHSCVPSWWEAMRTEPLPTAWRWHAARNAAGFARADRVLAPSASHAAALRRIYGPIPRLEIVHNASGAAAGMTGKRDFILAAGRWWDEAKSAATLDEAAIGAACEIVMAGPLEGPNGEAVRFRHARAAGTLSAAAMLALMREAAIFAAPSRYEPFGLAVLEAARCGAALVLSDIPTFRELWDGAAVFVPPMDAAGWRQAFSELRAEPDRRARLAEVARARSACFTPERHLEGVLAAYRGACARHLDHAVS